MHLSGVVYTVVATVVLTLVAADHRCGLTQCRLKTRTMEVESCGITEQVHYGSCEGNCHHEDPVYDNYRHWPEQKVCNGDWHHEVIFIQNCPIPVTYLSARSCTCGICTTENTYCGGFGQDLPGCLMPF